MNVPAGMKVYRGRHKYKAGDPLPASIGKALEKKLNKKPVSSVSGINKDSDK